MYVIDDIAYAGEFRKCTKVAAVRVLENYNLLVTFASGERKIFDFEPLLDFPCYKVLKDKAVFDRVYVEYGTAVWNDGEIDIAPETLYEKGVTAEKCRCVNL
jgi:hypothetical protein